ncbi:hypothetical protein R84B8_01446 [Treponema sp. R8-4-B8]
MVLEKNQIKSIDKNTTAAVKSKLRRVVVLIISNIFLYSILVITIDAPMFNFVKAMKYLTPSISCKSCLLRMALSRIMRTSSLLEILAAVLTISKSGCIKTSPLLLIR